MQKVLITGSEGFIGSRLVDKLVDNDDYLVLIETNKEELDSRIKHGGDRPETIIHCGAISDSGYDNPDIFEYNTESTRRLAEYARDQYANLIFLSSQAAYNPVNYYGYSKLYAEQYLARMVRNYCILRLPNVFGDENADKDSPSIVAKIMNKNLPFLLNECWRRFIHVDDVVGLILKLITDEGFEWGTFNVDAEEVRIESLLQYAGYENKYTMHVGNDGYYWGDEKNAYTPIVKNKEGVPKRIKRDDNLPLLEPRITKDVTEYVKGEKK